MKKEHLNQKFILKKISSLDFKLIIVFVAFGTLFFHLCWIGIYIFAGFVNENNLFYENFLGGGITQPVFRNLWLFSDEHIFVPFVKIFILFHATLYFQAPLIFFFVFMIIYFLFREKLCFLNKKKLLSETLFHFKVLLLACSFSLFVFIVLPSYYPYIGENNFENLKQQSYFNLIPEWALLYYKYAIPWNSFPSTHVSPALIMIFFLLKVRNIFLNNISKIKKIVWNSIVVIFCVWSFCIAISTVLAKFHYLFDFFTGTWVAIISWLICRKLK